jgi:hypothetical protein
MLNLTLGAKLKAGPLDAVLDSHVSMVHRGCYATSNALVAK